MVKKTSARDFELRALISEENYDPAPGPLPLDPTGRYVPVCLQMIARAMEDVMKTVYGITQPFVDPDGTACGESALFLNFQNDHDDSERFSTFLSHLALTLETMQETRGENCPDVRLALVDKGGSERNAACAPNEDESFALLAESPEAFVLALHELGDNMNCNWNITPPPGMPTGAKLSATVKDDAARFLDENPQVLNLMHPLYLSKDKALEHIDAISRHFDAVTAPVSHNISELMRAISTDQKKEGKAFDRDSDSDPSLWPH